MTVNLTAAQARALGLDLTGAKAAKVRTSKRHVTEGPYHTRCTCGEEFTVQAAETRHVAVGHNRFEIIT